MSITFKNLPLFSPASLSEEAEISILSSLIDDDNFSDTYVQRRLASYPWIDEDEKNIIILELMNHFWDFSKDKDFFSVFWDFDTIFSILDKKGHFIHQFEVFLLGWHLISHILPLDKSGIFNSKVGDSRKIFFSWLLASTAHDFGYPLQMARKLTKKLSNLYNEIHMTELSNRLKQLSENYGIGSEQELNKIKVLGTSKDPEDEFNLAMFIYRGILNSVGGEKAADNIFRFLRQKNNHGYVSAAILCRSYISFLNRSGLLKEKDEKWRLNLLEIASSAIALHAIPYKEKEYVKEISFNSNPISYILFIIDNLQEWNRYIRTSDKWPSYNLLNFESDYTNMKLSYVLTHENWNADMIKRVKDSIKEKSEIIYLPEGPRPSFNFNISIEFHSNFGSKFKDIQFII